MILGCRGAVTEQMKFYDGQRERSAIWVNERIEGDFITVTTVGALHIIGQKVKWNTVMYTENKVQTRNNACTKNNYKGQKKTETDGEVIVNPY